MAGSSSDSCFKRGKFSAPGFRFHPTDEELVVYYLKRKICGRRLRVNVIGVVDVYKMDPAELPGLSLLKSGDRQWFFFTPRSRKYPNAARSGRGTASGYWKATGKDRTIVYNSRSVGLKKTLVFYRGRAPSGERTDWVMHEYTMDEDELGRCKNAKDYYALYKLFQKSGVGPKNGEQYGAPFQEEEWVVDDDDASEDADNVAAPVDPLVHHENSRRVDNSMFFNPHLDDFEKLLHRIPEAPAVFPSQINELAGVPQVNNEEEIQSTLVNNSSGEFLVSGELGEYLPNGELYNRHSSFESLVSANLVEATKVKSTLKTSGMAPLVFEKEDYIEMDDLLIPELGASLTEKSAQLLNHGEFDDLNEYGQLFHDISMSLDIGPVFQFEEQTFDNQLNNFMDPSPTLNQFPDDMWLQDDQADVFDQPPSSSGAFASPSSGVNGQDQEGQNGDGTKSQFSSALWAFMESIPSTPASACEGPLNRTFVRMSSFSRIRFNGTSVANSKVAIARRRSRNRGFLLLSVFGALCAIFWLFLTTVGVLGRPVFS